MKGQAWKTRGPLKAAFLAAAASRRVRVSSQNRKPIPNW
jgi:hypothetical protein